MQTPGGYGCPEFAPPGLASVLVTEFREQTAEAPSAKLRRGNDRIKFWMRGHLNSKDREVLGRTKPEFILVQTQLTRPIDALEGRWPLTRSMRLLRTL